MVTALKEGGLRLEPLAGAAPDEQLRVMDLAGDGPILIGRARGCEVCLRDPTISRRHVSLVRRDDRWFVIDLGGRLGTTLNGVRLDPESPAVAAPGDFLRLGPYAFRFETGSSDGSTITSTRDVSPGTIVERVPDRELGSVAQRRLELLIEGAATICQAADEVELARAVVEMAVSGTGFPRAAFLRSTGSTDRVDVLAWQDSAGNLEEFSFSQSLLREASQGHTARLTRQMTHNFGQSIEALGIIAAICAPITFDIAIVGYLYLDARESEQAGDAESVGFCQALARLAGLALANLKRAELERRQDRLDDDLRAARQAQAILSPPENGEVGPLRYAMQTIPGRVVAGDLFDIFALGDEHVAICFGDVSGQGMRAAIHMSAVIAHLRAALPRDHDPATVMSEVNRYIAERSPDDVFVSLWVGVYDIAQRTLRYVDAGHGHWIICPNGGSPAIGPRPNGLLIGIDSGYVYEQASMSLAPGDRIVFISDGVGERASAEGELFGNQRAADVLVNTGTPLEDVSSLFAAVSKFAGGAGIADDTTVASIELVGE